MRPLLTLLFIACLLFSSCKKDDTSSPVDPNLAGQWEMIAVKNNSTHLVSGKPDAIPENIDISISFSSAVKGVLSGSLTTATTISGVFSISQKSAITIPAISLTPPAFDIFYGSMDWDAQFSNNITTAKSYYFDSLHNLNIRCGDNIELIFAKK